ncbi:hypothetical protein C5Y93_03080 [Blastopirellula marina]|uniref:Uncharacterized protein n=1 Tax=Blastopirellula marina TaxID=124 RepID=A0A2S8GUB7_9BACT|nr:hypothetical protein C5Y93_03080 [Blastopirellula marina]
MFSLNFFSSWLQLWYRLAAQTCQANRGVVALDDRRSDLSIDKAHGMMVDCRSARRSAATIRAGLTGAIFDLWQFAAEVAVGSRCAPAEATGNGSQVFNRSGPVRSDVAGGRWVGADLDGLLADAFPCSRGGLVFCLRSSPVQSSPNIGLSPNGAALKEIGPARLSP